MRYFDVTCSFGRPHVNEEIPTLEEAKSRAGDDEIYTEPAMRANPELADALDRWDRGDRSLRAHDDALFFLSCIIAKGNQHIGEAFEWVDDEDKQRWQTYGETDDVCDLAFQIVARMATWRMLIGLLDVPDREGIITGWDGPHGDLKPTPQERWDHYAATFGSDQAANAFGPRPTALESV